VIGPLRSTTGALEEDEGVLKSFFADITPKNPDLR